MKHRPVAIDLFAGCGGISLGLEAAGFDIGLAVEFDAIHALVHHCNFPYCKTLCRDISRLGSDEIRAALRGNGYDSDIDLIAGGPPCQGFSHIGKRQLDDPRNSLVFEYLRIVSDLRPRYFLFENVPGIASGDHRQFLEELIQEFEGLGYHITQPIRILDASEYGAPQRRKRLILIGSRIGETQAKYPTARYGECSGYVQDMFSGEILPFATAGDALEDLAPIEVYTEEDAGIDCGRLDYRGYRARYNIQPSSTFSKCHVRDIGERIYGHFGSLHTQESIARFAATVPGSVEPRSRFFKLAKGGLCNTLRAGTHSDKGAYTAPRPIHYSEPRCISIREAARLHTFPDWFQPHRTIWHGFREIGNAVVPALAKELGDSILRALGIDSKDLATYKLAPVSSQLLSYNMSQASAYWGIADDVIPKRRRAA